MTFLMGCELLPGKLAVTIGIDVLKARHVSQATHHPPLFGPLGYSLTPGLDEFILEHYTIPVEIERFVSGHVMAHVSRHDSRSSLHHCLLESGQFLRVDTAIIVGIHIGE